MTYRTESDFQRLKAIARGKSALSLIVIMNPVRGV